MEGQERLELGTKVERRPRLGSPHETEGRGHSRKGKGCDIGYALAASSCEGANNVETCTVTAFDAITAFAVPNPNCPSQSRRFFQVWLPAGSPRRANHSAYFGSAKFYLSQPFQPSTGAKVIICFKTVNACFRCKVHFRRSRILELQLLELLTFDECQK